MKIEFNMYWEVCGKQVVDVPDSLDVNDRKAVMQYLEDNWDSIPLPKNSEYVDGTCLPDSETSYRVVGERNWK